MFFLTTERRQRAKKIEEPWQFLVLVQIIIFVLGWPLEWTEILIIFVPIFLPMLDTFGVNPYFFAMLIALNLQTSFLTPPFGFALFYLRGVAPKTVKTKDIYQGVVPFIGIQLFLMILLCFWPSVATWLPSLKY